MTLNLGRWSRRMRTVGYTHVGYLPPFYRRFHKDLEQAPLGELPVLTKATLMDTFDEISYRSRAAAR